MIKKIILCLVVFSLMACDETPKKDSVGEAPEKKQTKSIELKKADPVPKTISQKEVTRIALVETKQFISNAKEKGIDTVKMMEEYEKVNKLFESGKYKKAQKMAVKMRQEVEKFIMEK